MTTEELRTEANRLYFEVATPEAITQARELYLKAAEDKDVISAVSLGGIAIDTCDYDGAKHWWNLAFDWYMEHPSDEVVNYVAFAHARYGDMLNFNYEELDPVPDVYRHMACIHYTEAIELGCTDCRAALGNLLYEGNWMPNCDPDVKAALKMWKEGMDDGDQQCTLRYCAHFIDSGKSDQNIVDILEALVRDDDNSCADACALLYHHYSRIGDDDLAAEWLECGLDMGSEMCEDIVADEREEEVGEDNWTRSNRDRTADEPTKHYDAEGRVIIVGTDGSFRIVHADASDWRSLPQLIGAESTDDMRCTKLHTLSKNLGLSGTLLAKLDRDAFRKPNLEPNWHASQWYDGMADLYGDMIICLEDRNYTPYSFADETEAQRVIDALRG